MAVINASVMPDVTQEGQRGHYTASVTHFYFPHTIVQTYWNIPVGDDGVIDPFANSITSHSYPVNGSHHGSMFTDFYNQVYFLPPYLELGSIVNADSGEFVIWNARLDASTINGVTVEGHDEGSGFDSPLFTESFPIVMPFLGELRYPWLVDQHGSDSIDIKITVDSDSNDPIGFVTGQRSVIFSASPLRDFTHHYIFHTRVTDSFNGEQRSSMTSQPREKFEYQASVSKEDQYTFRQLMELGCRLALAVPMWEDFVPVPSLAAGSVSVADAGGGFLSRAFYVGGRAVIWQDADQFEVVELTGVAADGTLLEFKRATTTEATNAFIMPLRLGVAYDDVRFKRSGRNRYTMKATFTTKDMLPDYDRNATLTTFESRVVLDDPNFQKRATDKFSAVYEDFEGIGGRRDFFLDRGYLKTDATYVWRCSDRPGLNKLREFIHTVRGKWKSFWLPRFGIDFTLFSDITIATSYAAVALSKFSLREDQIQGSAVMITTYSGQQIFRRVIGVSYNPDHVRLVFDALFDEAISPADIEHFCIMDRVRLRQDVIEVVYKDIDDVSCKLGVVGVTD